MKGAEEQRIRNTKIALIAILSVVVIIILSALVGIITSKKRLELYNIDQIDSGLSTGEIEELEGFIWQRLKDTQGFEDEAGIIALIRPSSYVWTEENGIKSYQFIVDIDEFKATYEVHFALVGDEGFYESPGIDCPVPELMKYAETNCDGRSD